uniref:Membrane protein n=1 Tax=Magnetospirillum gryphiswaldense TaxID=55518 RepID=A4TTM7_9PROT|nr:membrane protein [Magnetospirillum gryphiswaldense MSR-1]
MHNLHDVLLVCFPVTGSIFSSVSSIMHHFINNGCVFYALLGSSIPHGDIMGLLIFKLDPRYRPMSSIRSNIARGERCLL